jgi:hypothetical protein
MRDFLIVHIQTLSELWSQLRQEMGRWDQAAHEMSVVDSRLNQALAPPRESFSQGLSTWMDLAKQGHKAR